MNTKLTTFSQTLIKRIRQHFFFIVICIQSANLLSQQSNLSCNSSTPWIAPLFTVTETHSSPGLACWEGDALCPGDDVPANVTNSSTTDFASGSITGIGELTLRVTDNTNDYSSGNFAGYRIASELLDISLLGSITISTYLDNAFVESVSGGSLLAIDIDLTNDQYDVGFITSSDFDAIEITIDNVLGIGDYDVYYAIMQDFCPGPELVCNTQTAMNLPDYPVSIDYQDTGSGGVTIGEVLNAENAISSSTTDFASLINIAGIAGSTFIAVEEQIVNYPAGTFVGFDIQNLTLAGAGILNNLTIQSYLDDVEQESFTGPDLFISASALGNSGRQTVGFVTSTPVDKVKLIVNQPAGLNLGTTRVYSAIFQEFCAGPPLDCNEITEINNPDYPVYIDGEHTGFTGVACALCDVLNAGNVIDGDESNYAEIIVVTGVTSTGSLAVKDQLSDYPAGTFAGFHIENPSLVNANVLTGITISTYLNGVLQESETNLGALVTVGSGLLVGTGEQFVGFVTTEPFDEIKISLANIIGSFDIGTTRVYGAVLENFCPADIECDTTYYLNTPTFPVYIDAFLTGIDGVACVACEVEDEQNAITADNTDYGTITVVANVIGSASIAVADALYTYPAGTFAGFVIEDLGFLIEADLFESLTISTYNNGEFQELRSGGDLIDLAVIILFISADEGRYNVGFETLLPFDEIRITVGSLASAINLVRVYSAFVDTRSSNGSSLMCVMAPVAVDDHAVTDEDIPVNIDVLENDSDPEGPIGEPVTIEDPMRGTIVLNQDSTYTYTPDDNFVGVDTFSYAVCNTDATPLCDSALVIITVLPVIDTIEETIPEDSTLMVCANDITTFDSPAMSISICDLPSSGSATVNGDCVTYDPAPGFIGNDTMCVVTCHPFMLMMCDTTIVIITVIPVQFPPLAMDDEAVTNEDEPVTIDVLENDSDPDSPLGIPVIIELPDNGNVVVNPDSTVTYTPEPDFMGIDTFTYAICDDTEPPLCDSAFVIITVIPQPDTLSEIISVDSVLELCVSAWVKIEVEIESVSVCAEPENGIFIIVDTCVQYVPEPEFNGQDTMCVEVCDVNGSCDTAVIIVIIELPLPVRWLSFNVEREGDQARLVWKTADEINNDRFEIEKSFDGKTFFKIGEVNAVNLHTEISTYVFDDKSPKDGHNYYRIRQIDINGRVDYSSIKLLSFRNDGAGIEVWPNPSEGKISINMDDFSDEYARIQLLNIDSKIVYESKTSHVSDVIELNLHDVGPGIYSLIIESDTKRFIQKIVVVR